MTIQDLPTLNATLNFISSVFLLLGYLQIRKGNRGNHKKLMVSALVTSALFLISYVIYHYNAGSVPYPYHDWTRPLYFTLLIPHIILAAVQTPFILYIVYQAFKENFEKHKRLAKYVWSVWMFVSVTGVLIFLMLYKL